MREIYVVFHGNSKYFGSKYLEPGFTHVFVIERCARGWTCIDGNRSSLEIKMLPISNQIDMMPEYVNQNPSAHVLKIYASDPERSKYPSFGMLSCVSTVQYILGIYYPSVITPYALYNKLLDNRINHLEVFNYGRQTRRSKKGRGVFGASCS